MTGASRGIGMETALRLAQSGFRVWGSMRDLKQAGPLLDEARKRAVKMETVRLDVTDQSSIAAAVAEIVERSGSLYGLVNNAGVTKSAYFEDFPDAELRSIFETNVFGVMNVTRAVLPHLRAAGRGRIVMLSSLGGRLASVCMAPYFASKFAIEGFGEALMQEVAGFGIQVVLVEPGVVATDIWDKDRQFLPSSQDPNGPYYKWFCRVQKETDALLKMATVTPADVADTISRAFAVKRPQLRYVVGWKGSLLLSLRRHLPGELFDRAYFGAVIRRLTPPSTE